MTGIIFRDLPGVSRVERQLDMQFRDQLLDDEIEELPHLVDEVSTALFGITQRDTFYWALPDLIKDQYSRIRWETNFDVLGQYNRDPNAHWRAFDLDLRCEQGHGLHCFELFGRQLICALHEIHPRAFLAFADRETCRRAVEALQRRRPEAA